MKKIFLALVLISWVSCVSTKYNVYETPNDFANIKAGTKYTFYNLQDRKLFITITSVDKDSIIGMRKNERIAISKKDIKEIKKNNTGGTLALVGTGAVFLGATWALVDATRGFGSGFGGENGNP